MDLDESFTAYAGARWPALYRLAVLLAGESDADDLAQQVLFQAYRAWDRVMAASSPDAYVRKIMVNTLISQRSRHRRGLELVTSGRVDDRVASVEDDVVQHDELWNRIFLLPPKQRAVIVLRYYEDLSEQAIADVLGCAPGTVKSQAAAALRTLRIGYDSASDLSASGGTHA
ncbi:SigE family RNA polymerase sigma factor [Nocardioides marmorisolisilvae]|uniref:SigE family RNA polymerase sigma factor n=1 Tax=Nocardioides marmorisolisilvae TaxID=1542737 RepID=A0A3N0E0R0_9ACTN|nr:SigE family RNA polymerase sigma factor [Nocardioides marmorisolisilvae]RNL81444.1 SigE family RNA polymerase sigma factor [Nocardioides marmorisolisilvae]